MAFQFIPQAIPEVVLVKPQVFGDSRGFFMESYQKSAFHEAGITVDFVQDNHSKSSKGVLRGLHFQNPPYAQGKLVRCSKGEIFDVAVDIRKNSPTFGKWVGVLLSEENKEMLYIPEGFAHGFMVLSDEAELLYKATREYNAASEGGVLWNDPQVAIQWPAYETLLLSQKDQEWKPLSEQELFFEY